MYPMKMGMEKEDRRYAFIENLQLFVSVFAQNRQKLIFCNKKLYN